jgi:NAD(P)-dependent dehydrogenase (short-subunit alcohol dehydrogenase family)
MILAEKKVFITGASRGIGRAIAQAFREAGAHVIGTATTEKAPDEVCHEMHKVDFTDQTQVLKCAEYLRNLQPDILVNNAGINKIAPFVDIELEDFQRIHQVNVVAPMLLCQAVIPAMKEKGWGRIVNISSIWGKIGKEYRASYSASKFALDGLTLAIANEHAQDGILANCIAPGFTDTELTRNVLGEAGIKKLISTVPIHRMAQVDEIAKFVLWLSNPDNTYISGQNIAIDGGFSRA